MSISHRDLNCVPKEKVQTLASFEGIQGGEQDIRWLPVVRRRCDYPQNHAVLSELPVEGEYMRRPDLGDGRRFLLGQVLLSFHYERTNNPNLQSQMSNKD